MKLLLPGKYSSRSIVTDNDLASNSWSVSLLVLNTAPEVDWLGHGWAPVGSPFSDHGNFNDVGQDSWTGRVDCGDGTGWQRLSILNRTITCNHVYSSNRLRYDRHRRRLCQWHLFALNTVTVPATDPAGFFRLKSP